MSPLDYPFITNMQQPVEVLIYFSHLVIQNFISCGYWPLSKPNVCLRYDLSIFPSGCFLMASRTCLSTVCWSAFRCSEGLYSSFLDSKISPSLLLAFLGALRKYSSFTLSGTFTPDTSTLVLVANKYIWLTRRNGQPLHFMGPVIKRSPLASCFRTITRLPLWTPASRIATAPGARLDRRDLLCFEKKFFDVPFGAASIVGESLMAFLVGTIRVPPLLAPPIFFSTNAGFLGAAFLAVFFFKNLYTAFLWYIFDRPNRCTPPSRA